MCEGLGPVNGAGTRSIEEPDARRTVTEGTGLAQAACYPGPNPPYRSRRTVTA
jgi:hypothetical protein